MDKTALEWIFGVILAIVAIIALAYYFLQIGYFNTDD